MTNLYAIIPTYCPGDEIEFVVAASDEQALKAGVFVAARDLTKPGYGSPSAEVYLIARDVQQVGTAQAADAPLEWKWAHPAVEQALAIHDAEMAADEAIVAERRGGK